MIPTHQYITILPELVLSIVGIVIMLADPFLDAKNAVKDSRTSRQPLGWLAFLGTLAALGTAFYQATQTYNGAAFFGMIRMDAFSVFFHVVVIAVSALAILASLDYLEAQHIRSGEYYALILFATVGMGLLASAVELVMLFISLEISSISTYILAGYRRRFATSSESSIKYFLLGSFATAFFLYGIALIYGATGTTNITQIAHSILSGHAVTGQDVYQPLIYLSVVLMFVGMGFKVAAAPFHVWTPDVYEGAPAPVVALMSTGPKAAAFALLLRVFFASFGWIAAWWMPLVWVAAMLSMTVGNLGALMQNNVKRMLAYSSIAHAGYILVAFAAVSQRGISAALFYSASYAAMNIGAFAVVSYFAGTGEKYVSIDDYAGLGRRSPVLAATLTVFMLSLIGIPLTGGFFAKFYVFTAALQANLVWLTVIGLINSAVAAYYYLRLIVVMYMKEGDDSVPIIPVPIAVATSLLIAAGLTIYLGVMPGHVLDYAGQGARDLLR